MPPHLHPKSTATSTLFAGTLLASFIVVGIPHVFPCPRPRTGYADAAQLQFDDDGRPIRRKVMRRNGGPTTTTTTTESKDGSSPTVLGAQESSVSSTSTPTVAGADPRFNLRKGLTQTKDIAEEAALFRELQREAEALEQEARQARECPVPKPRGMIGRWLGFEEKVAIDEKS